jgi:hypothetical protein
MKSSYYINYDLHKFTIYFYVVSAIVLVYNSRYANRRKSYFPIGLTKLGASIG